MQPNSPYGQNPNQQQGGVPQQPQAPPQQMYPAPPVQPGQPIHDYEFIMNPAAQKRAPLKLPGGNSMIGRVALVIVGLIVLLMVFTVLKSVFNHKPDLTPFVTILQDQQEVIHIATNGSQQTDISQLNKNLAITAKLTLSTDQKRVYAYLQGNGVKFNDKTFPVILNARVDANTDSQLATAVTDNTYDIVFRSAMQQHLTSYMQDLKHVYDTSKGAVGHTMLTDDYNNAQKLLDQLNQKVAAPN